MRRLRVLIVDDSVVMRRMISDMVLSDPALEVAGIAHHGYIALAKIPQVTPDIVTLDLDMPEMDGLETLTRIKRRISRPARHHCQRVDRARNAVDARRPGHGRERLRDQALFHSAEFRPAPPRSARNCSAKSSRSAQPISAAVPAFRQKAAIRADERCAQPGRNRRHRRFHRWPECADATPARVSRRPFPFPGGGAAHAAACSPASSRSAWKSLHICVCARPPTATRLVAGTIWIAPGDHHLEMERTPPRSGHPPEPGTAGKFVPSGGRSDFSLGGGMLWLPRVLGVVMTGMGHDGLQGSRCIY